MEQDNAITPSFPEYNGLLAVNAPSDLLSKMLSPLGLKEDLHAELQQDTALSNLESKQWTERVAAVHTFIAPIPIALVVKALHDENEHVRAAAARALEKANDFEGEQLLISALRDTSWFVRATAAQSLGRLGCQRAIAPLIEVLGNDADEAVRATAAEALGRMRETTPLHSLLRASRDSSWLVREAAVSALGKRDYAVPRTFFVEASQDADLSVREAALIVLNNMDPESTVTNALTQNQAPH